MFAAYQEFAMERVADGASPLGLEQAFAMKLGITKSQWSQLKKHRAISDVQARRLECKLHKPSGWLDMRQGDSSTNSPKRTDPARARFLQLAATAWDADNGSRRRALLQLVAEHAHATEGS